MLGGYGICDDCNTPVSEGYFVTVLNSWFCPECYEQWLKTAINYEEDREFEKGNFKRYSDFFSSLYRCNEQA